MIRLQTLSRSDSSSSTDSSTSKSGLSPAAWPNKYIEDQETYSPDTAFQAAPPGTLGVQTWHRADLGASPGRSPSLNSNYSRTPRGEGTAYTADSPRPMADRRDPAQPHHVIGDMTPTTGNEGRWSEGPLSPTRDIVLGDSGTRANGAQAWTGGHARKRSTLTDWK